MTQLVVNSPTQETPSRPEMASAPHIRHCRALATEGDGVILAAGQRYFTLTCQRLSPQDFMAIKRYLDGRHTLEEISAATGHAAGDIARLVEALADAGLIKQSRPAESFPAGDFARLIEDTCVAWTRQMSGHELFRGLQAHSLPREVFTGLILETYHYVRSSSRHIAVAIAHCQEAGTEAKLAEFFVEEYGHAELIMQSLERLGLRRDEIESSYPVSGTLSLIHMLCDIAQRDTLAYLSSIVFLEARQETFEAAAKSLRDICTGYGWPASSVEPLISHVRMDLEAGHASLLDECLKDRLVIPAGQAHRAVNALHDLKHAFEDYYEQIVKYYSAASNHIPRLPLNFFSL